MFEFFLPKFLLTLIPIIFIILFFIITTDVIFMEGHTDAVQETNEQVLNKLSKRHSYSNILDINLGAHSSPETKRFKATLEGKLEDFNQEEEVNDYEESAVNFGGGAKKSEPVQPPKATMDPRVVNLITSITENIANLAGQVNTLSNRVDNFATDQEAPILMVPQRVKVNMNRQLGDTVDNMKGLQSRVQFLEKRSSSPLMMVPQYQPSPHKQ